MIIVIVYTWTINFAFYLLLGSYLVHLCHHIWKVLMLPLPVSWDLKTNKITQKPAICGLKIGRIFPFLPLHITKSQGKMLLWFHLTFSLFPAFVDLFNPDGVDLFQCPSLCQSGPHNLRSFLAANSTKNYFPIVRMLIFLWHARQKCCI